MTERKAPEIRQIPVSDFDASALPPDARTPGTDAFETAVITHFGVHYAEKGWNAAVTVDDEFIRIVAVPETGSSRRSTSWACCSTASSRTRCRCSRCWTACSTTRTSPTTTASA
jgi:hypothetical protein